MLLEKIEKPGDIQGVMLPITRPAIVTYLHHAYPLAIAQADRRGAPFLAAGFLQLYTRKNKDGKSAGIDFYSYSGYYPECPFLKKMYETGATLPAFGNNRIEQVRALLDAGSYVEPILNEYWVPGKAAYRKFEFFHQNLVYGYSDAQRLFFAQGFMESGQYVDFTIPYDVFAQASAGIDDVRRYLVLTGPGVVPTFDPATVKSYLQDFIDGRCSVGAPDPIMRDSPMAGKVAPLAAWKSRLTGVPPLRKAYGQNTYGIALEFVQYNNRALIDIRPWCLFYEHKVRLLHLLDYLERERQVVVAPALREEFAMIENDFLALRNHMLESRLQDRAVKAAALAANLERLAGYEKAAIDSLIAVVR